MKQKQWEWSSSIAVAGETQLENVLSALLGQCQAGIGPIGGSVRQDQ